MNSRFFLPHLSILIPVLLLSHRVAAQTDPQPEKKPPAAEKKNASADSEDPVAAPRNTPAVQRPLKLIEAGDAKDQEPSTAGSHFAEELTPEHKLYAPLAGEYRAAVTFHGMGDQTPQGTKGRVKYESVLGGRFLLETATSSVLGDGFDWIGLYGYDTRAKKFTVIWADNGRDTYDTATGTYDATTRTFTFSGQQDDPRTGGKISFRWTIRHHPPNEITVEMHQPDDKGEERLVMRIVGDKE